MRILQDISLEIQAGDILCLLGPNGIGKTTLFKSVLGFLPLLDGEIRIDGEDIAHWPRKRLAKAVGYVPQVHTPPFPFSVREVITMGRVAHMGMFASPGPNDIQIAEQSMERLGISHLADKVYTEISGGECQMVLIARALAQNPQILVMDEPTANLDFGNQVRVLRQINRLAAEGMAIIMTTHFPDHAFLCSSSVCLLQKGQRILKGKAEEVVTEQNLNQAYGVNVRIIAEEDAEAGWLKSCVPVVVS